MFGECCFRFFFFVDDYSIRIVVFERISSTFHPESLNNLFLGFGADNEHRQQSASCSGIIESNYQTND